MRTLMKIAALVVILACLGVCPPGTAASDHGDTPLLKEIGRHDARITDLYTFLRGSRIVFVVCLDPTVPHDATDYRFAPDLTVQVYVDNDSPVALDDPDDLRTFGGTLTEPQRLAADASFRVRFDEQGRATLKTTGLRRPRGLKVQLFTGLRDDPFIRGPRIGHNVAAIVIELPLVEVLGDSGTLLVWATSQIEQVHGPLQDMAGRALRSQFPENDPMNTMRPHDHAMRMEVVPDVMILDTSRPVAFPNGRELTDDVVDLVGDRRVLDDDDPFPAQNDLPFLSVFPYLAPPHPPR